MGFWGRLFGTEKVVDGLYNGIDKSFFTDEEKANHFLKILKAYEPFKLAQRLLALIVGIPYVIIYMISALTFVYGMSIENLDHATRVIEASKSLATLNNDNLGMPFAIILGFYFSGGMIEGGINAWKGKK